MPLRHWRRLHCRKTEPATAGECEVWHARALPGRIIWAWRLKRVFEIDMQRCPKCCGGGGELRIIAAILERVVIEKTLAHLGLDPQPPTRVRTRELELRFAA